MRVGITKFVTQAAIAALVMVGGVMPVLAQTPNFPNFSSVANLTLNGNAAQSTPVLRLTPNSTDQVGSAWFKTAQPVSGAFSTTFTFQLSATSTYDADGIAFVIQNSALTAIGPAGCGLGFGDSSSGCAPSSGGIPNSVAIELNTFQNSGDPNANDVTIQSCQTGPNSIDPGVCRVASNSSLPITLADGNVHSVTITYTPPATGSGPGSLDVSLDNTDLFPGGVAFDMTSIGLTNGTAAWVGFTAATGGGDDNQDILSWTFTPQTQSAVVTSAAQSTLPFQNAANNNAYDYTAQLTSGAQTVQVKPILMSQSDCNAIVQKSFWPAHCFVYQNAENTGLDEAVMFEVTCPQTSTGTCSTTSFQELGTDFQFLHSDNPLFVYPGILGLLNPFPGWLKGDGGPDPLHPCTPPTTGALFQSNQVDLFFIDGGTTKGRSGGGASCWVATYDTPGEALPGIKITSPTSTTYTQNQVVTASYTCSDPTTSKPATSLTGPYLTEATCTQSELLRPGYNTNSCSALPGPQSCTGPVDTATVGLHSFIVTSIDSGGNTNVQAVIYNVNAKKK
jgi:Bacterial lectin